MNDRAAKKALPLLPLTTKLGAVVLGVTDPLRALKIWRDVLGLEVIAQPENELHLGVGQETLIVLQLDARVPVQKNTTGLYHVALHVPHRYDLAALITRATEAGVRVAPTDHLVSEAIYLWDEDGNGIEVAFETPWRGQLSNPDQTGSYGIDQNGNPHSGREPIDLKNLLAELAHKDDVPSILSAGTRIGHIHLHVGDLNEAMLFYRDVLGFAEVLMMTSWGMGDVGLDYVPHTIAFNIWAGPNAKPQAKNAAGLRWFNLVLPDKAALNDVKDRLLKAKITVREQSHGLEISDPWQNQIRLSIAV